MDTSGTNPLEEAKGLNTEVLNDVIQSATKPSKPELENKTENSDPVSNTQTVLSVTQNGKTENGNGQPNDIRNHESFKTDDESNADDFVCGIGSFKPKWLQKYARIEIFVALYCLIGIVHGSTFTYLIGTISTLEKRFAFKSKTSGVLLIVDEITPSLMGIIVGYIGGKTHRPRLLGLGMMVAAACCFTSTLPFFIYGSAKHLSAQTTENSTGTDFCEADTPKKAFCGDDSDAPPTLPAMIPLVIAFFLKGFSNISMVVGVVYMDDNSKKRNVPLYFGLTNALQILGPVCGYLLSSFALKFYENPFVDPGFGPEDPRWIGAWWMGFIVIGVMLIIFSVPLFLFPRRLPIHKVKSRNEEDKNIKDFLKGIALALKRLGKNPLYTTQIVVYIFAIYGSLSFYAMLPKYMENQFRMSASEASLYSGPAPLVGVLLATVAGGFFIWKYKPSIKLLLLGIIASEFVYILGFLSFLYPQCQLVDMKNYGYNDNGLILESECNMNCNCGQTAFTPFCGPDGKTTYFSPCFAGCTTEGLPSNSSENKKVYSNCSCIPSTDTSSGGPLVEGYCPDENCWSQALTFIIILPLPPLIASFYTSSKTMIMLRSIRPEDKSVALGTMETIFSLTSFIPLPIIVGALFDSTCLVWEETCGQTGNCWFYDVYRLKYILVGFSVFFSFLSLVGFAVLYTMHLRVRDLYAEDDAEDVEFHEKYEEATTKF